MRVLKASALVSLFAVQLLAADTLSGRLVFQNGEYICDQRCVVTLLASGVRPVQTVMADLSGHFTFNNVARGSYTIRVEIDGFEPVTQTIDGFDVLSDMNIVVPLIRKQSTSESGAAIVNVSEFMDRYPKKPVSFFEKGSE